MITYYESTALNKHSSYKNVQMSMMSSVSLFYNFGIGIQNVQTLAVKGWWWFEVIDCRKRPGRYDENVNNKNQGI